MALPTKKAEVNTEWIQKLTGAANDAAELRENDTVVLRIATSTGRPVCAHLDIHHDGSKIGTAGTSHRLSFATSGIDTDWTNRVVAGVVEAYRKIDEKAAKVSTRKPSKKRQTVNDDWIVYLTEEANKSARLRDSDSIVLRIATSSNRPVCATIDIYQDSSKIGTAGRDHRLSFATSGLTEEWMAKVDAGVDAAYEKIDSAPTVLKAGESRITIKDGRVESAIGSVDTLLTLLDQGWTGEETGPPTV